MCAIVVSLYIDGIKEHKIFPYVNYQPSATLHDINILMSVFFFFHPLEVSGVVSRGGIKCFTQF